MIHAVCKLPLCMRVFCGDIVIAKELSLVVMYMSIGLLKDDVFVICCSVYNGREEFRQSHRNTTAMHVSSFSQSTIIHCTILKRWVEAHLVVLKNWILCLWTLYL